MNKSSASNNHDFNKDSHNKGNHKTDSADISDVTKTAMIADIDIEALKHSATEASNLLKSLSHPDRLLLLCQIVQGQMADKELCVQDLEQTTGIKQPSLSQQLGILRQNGLVNTRREGRQIFYRMASDDALAVMAVLYERFCQQP